MRRIFAAPPDLRPQLLSELDDSTRHEVEALLAADARPGPTIPALGPYAVGAIEESSLEPGTTLGAFTIVREIGRGGMGAVYLAEREHPFRQRAAIKVIQSFQQSQLLTAAFHREREILASFEHPGIARVLDGGATPDGLSYLIMEFVDGQPLGSTPLDSNQAVSHCIQVADAVEYAHQRFIIHSDLKPANILLTNAGQVKLLDFGIATIKSASAAFLTPEFASPEQQRGEPLTAASDVFSLGCILRKLVPTPDPELQAIIAKATAAPAPRRYQSANALKLDLQRWQRREPVQAYSNARLYHWRTWLRRNPLAAAAATLGILALILGTAISTWQALEANRSRRLAEQRYRDLYRLSADFLTEFYETNEAKELPVAARSWMVERTRRQLSDMAKVQPNNPELAATLADAHLKMGDLLGNFTSQNLGNTTAARTAYERALAILQPFQSNEVDLLRLRASMKLADLLQSNGEAEQAGRRFREIGNQWRKLGNLNDPKTAANLALAMMKYAQSLALGGNLPAAAPILREAVEIMIPIARANPNDSRIQRVLISGHSRLAFVHTQSNNNLAALDALAKAIAVAEAGMRQLPQDTDLRQNAIVLLFQLGSAHANRNHNNEAERAFRESIRLAGIEAERDSKNVQVLRYKGISAMDLGLLLARQQRHNEANVAFKLALDTLKPLGQASGASMQARLDEVLAESAYGHSFLQRNQPREALLFTASAMQRVRQLPSSQDTATADRTTSRVQARHGLALLANNQTMLAKAMLLAAEKKMLSILPKFPLIQEDLTPVQTALSKLSQSP
jgi:serine/threonine protein kinase